MTQTNSRPVINQVAPVCVDQRQLWLTFIVADDRVQVAMFVRLGEHEMKATWNGQVIAESDDIATVEGNAYFPLESVKPDVLRDSATHSTCSWKGIASYYSLRVGGQTNKDAAWYYPEPKQAAAEIKNRVAFWKGVSVTP